MKIKNIGSNVTEVHANNGDVILVSYQTPVAYCAGDGSGFFRTAKKWSVTTSKHINKWLDGSMAQNVEQSVLDGLL